MDGQPTASPDHSKTPTKWRVALGQMCSTREPKKNIATIKKLIRQAKKQDALMVTFPEVCNIREKNKPLAWQKVYTQADDPYLPTIQDLARELDIWVLLGSYIIRTEDSTEEQPKFYNRSFLISNNGEIVAQYDKIYMFDVQLDTGEVNRESETVVAGKRAVTYQGGPFPMDQFGSLGLTICYDVRFPSLYWKLNQMGAGIVFVSSAFTVPTGEGHWHTLLRARAIENSYFIIGTAQGGKHQDGRSTYGHSMVVGPWGQIIAELKPSMWKKNRLLVVDLDPTLIHQARRQVPAYRTPPVDLT